MIVKSTNQNQIEMIFGECSDVLNSLLDYLNKFFFTINKNNYYFYFLSYSTNDTKIAKNLTKMDHLNHS